MQVEPFVCYFLLAAQLGVYAMGTWVGATQVRAAAAGGLLALQQHHMPQPFCMPPDSACGVRRNRNKHFTAHTACTNSSNRRALRRPVQWPRSWPCCPLRCSRPRARASGGASAAASCCTRERARVRAGGARTSPALQPATAGAAGPALLAAALAFHQPLHACLRPLPTLQWHAAFGAEHLWPLIPGP